MSGGIALEGVLVVVFAFAAAWGVFRWVSMLSSRIAIAVLALGLWVLDFVRIHWIDLELPIAHSHWQPGGEILPYALFWGCMALIGAKWGAMYVLIVRARRAYDAAK